MFCLKVHAKTKPKLKPNKKLNKEYNEEKKTNKEDAWDSWFMQKLSQNLSLKKNERKKTPLKMKTFKIQTAKSCAFSSSWRTT